VASIIFITADARLIASDPFDWQYMGEVMAHCSCDDDIALLVEELMAPLRERDDLC
jgi:hypothetical protein